MKEFFQFLISKAFLKQLLFVLLFLGLVLMAVLAWLRSYTNHGQKIELPDYTNVALTTAEEDAEKRTFKIIVSDSIHIVGREGGIIIAQNPDPASMVKENRKIYVTTTKYNPDNILVKDLPLLYGTNYNQAEADLKSRFIYSKIKSKKYDAGQPNHILEVWYDGKQIINRDRVKSDVQIDKGGTLEFVVSERQGGSFPVPDLVCKKLSDAQSYMLYSKLKIGRINEVGEIENADEAWIVGQFPKADGSRELGSGSTIDISISSSKPKNCN